MQGFDAFAPMALGIFVQAAIRQFAILKPWAWFVTLGGGIALYAWGAPDWRPLGPEWREQLWAFVQWLVQAAGWTGLTSLGAKAAVAAGANPNHPAVPVTAK